MASLFFPKQNRSPSPSPSLQGPCWVPSGALSAGLGLGLGSPGALPHLLSACVIVHRWVDLETWRLALWGFGNCLELSREAVSSATALAVRSTLCLESFWL